MRKTVQNHLLIGLGWFFVALGFVGAFLPLLPTTIFLILALALFSKSSPRFHQMLLRNKWFGPTLVQWEQSRSMPRHAKHKAYFLIVAAFSVSIVWLNGQPLVQWGVVGIAAALLFFLWRIREEPLIEKGSADHLS